MTLQNCRGSWVPPIVHDENLNPFHRYNRSFQSISCFLGWTQRRGKRWSMITGSVSSSCRLRHPGFSGSGDIQLPTKQENNICEHGWGDLWPSQWLGWVSDTWDMLSCEVVCTAGLCGTMVSHRKCKGVNYSQQIWSEASKKVLQFKSR